MPSPSLQSNYNTEGGDVFCTTNLPSVGVGHLLVVGVFSTDAFATSVTDDAGGGVGDTFVQRVGVNGGGNRFCAIYDCLSSIGGATTVNFTAHFGLVTSIQIIVGEYTPQGGFLQGVSNAWTSGPATDPSVSLPSSVSNDLVFMLMSGGGTATVAGNIGTNPSFTLNPGSPFSDVACADGLASGGTINLTGVGSDTGWLIAGVEYSAAGGGGGITVGPVHYVTA